jgi:anti-sigma factor RsiW
MKCREANLLIADWVAGRLEPGVAPRMQEHLSVCERCRMEASLEAQMRDRLGSLTAADLRRDITSDVLARIAEARKPARLWAPRRAPAFAVAVAGVACAIVLFVATGSDRKPQPGVTSVDETKVIRMVADMQQMPDGSEESLFASGVRDPWARSLDSGGN